MSDAMNEPPDVQEIKGTLPKNIVAEASFVLSWVSGNTAFVFVCGENSRCSLGNREERENLLCCYVLPGMCREQQM